jgi:hypothetical protein
MPRFSTAGMSWVLTANEELVIVLEEEGPVLGVELRSRRLGLDGEAAGALVGQRGGRGVGQHNQR